LIYPKRRKSLGARFGSWAWCDIRCIFLREDIQWIVVHYPGGCINLWVIFFVNVK
jgi:hypothetical protein